MAYALQWIGTFAATGEFYIRGEKRSHNAAFSRFAASIQVANGLAGAKARMAATHLAPWHPLTSNSIPS